LNISYCIFFLTISVSEVHVNNVEITWQRSIGYAVLQWLPLIPSHLKPTNTFGLGIRLHPVAFRTVNGQQLRLTKYIKWDKLINLYNFICCVTRNFFILDTTNTVCVQN
jgi:hypothetical protein